jgi:putative MATE family efflux protein
MQRANSGPAAAARGIFDQSRPLWQVMLFFLIPLMVGNLLQSASGTLTSIFIGRLIGVNGLAAISAFFPIFFFLISFLIGLSSGASVLIGQAYGARDEHRLKQVSGTTISFMLLLGTALAIFGALFTDKTLVLLGTPANILPDSIAYARFVFFSLPVAFVFLMYVSIMRGIGDAATPFWFLLLFTLLSLLATPAFILGWLGLPHLGVSSAAAGFLFSSVMSLVSLVIYLRAIKHPLALDAETLHNFRIRWPVLAAVVRIGVPTGLQVVMVSLAEIAVISFVNHFGSKATAAYGAVNQIVSYVQFPAVSISITASIFGAQAIGAGREDLLRRVIHAGIGLNYAIGAVLIGLSYIFSRELVSLFITDPNTVEIAHSLLMITLWSYLIFGNSAVLSGVMRASGTVIVPTLNGIFAIWAIEVPVAYILMQHLGLNGIWVGYPAGFIVALSLQSLYYFLVWKRRPHKPLLQQAAPAE